MEDKRKTSKVGKVYPYNIYEYVIKTFEHAKKEGKGTINDKPFCDNNEDSNVLQIFKIWHNAGYPFLTPRQKHIILSRFSELKTLDAIGTQFNISRASVETSLRNAIGKFRTLLYQYYSAVSIRTQNLPADFEIKLLSQGICSYTNPEFAKQLHKSGKDTSISLIESKPDKDFILKLYKFILKCNSSYYSVDFDCGNLNASYEEIYDALSLMMKGNFSFLSSIECKCLYLHINGSHSEDKIASFLNESTSDVSDMLISSGLKIWNVLDGLYNKDTSIYLIDLPSSVRTELITKGIGTTEDIATAFDEYTNAKAIVDNLKIIPTIYNSTKALVYPNLEGVSIFDCNLSVSQQNICARKGIKTVQDLLSADDRVLKDIVSNSKSINPNSSPVITRNKILDRCASLPIETSSLSPNAKSTLLIGGYATMKDVMLVNTKVLIRKLPFTIQNGIYNEINAFKDKVIREILKKEGL